MSLTGRIHCLDQHRSRSQSSSERRNRRSCPGECMLRWPRRRLIKQRKERSVDAWWYIAIYKQVKANKGMDASKLNVLLATVQRCDISWEQCSSTQRKGLTYVDQKPESH
jgi:hypothetical protein